MSRILRVLATAALSTVAACSGEPAATPNTPSPPAAASIAVTLTPPSTTLDACQSAPFKAAVTGTANPGVVWSVKEGLAGGTITAEGVYIAPPAPGTYHVVATSQADPTRTATATITVGPEKVLSVSVTPGSGTVQANGTLSLSALVTTTCGTFSAQ